MTETMKNMDPEQMKKMMEMSQKLAGKGIGPGSTASCFWVRPLDQLKRKILTHFAPMHFVALGIYKVGSEM